jgi:hypothetical protein
VPIAQLPYPTLSALLARELVRDEDDATEALMRRVRSARRSGSIRRAEFVAMCRWKSPRAAPLYARNSPAAVRRAFREVFARRTERARIEALIALRGVSVPVASAVLTLLDPKRYGVLDIRVWQLLHALGVVSSKPAGRGFTAADWEQYLQSLRAAAERIGVSVRCVEYSLFLCHRKFQVGRLYGPEPGRSGRRAQRSILRRAIARSHFVS